MVTDQEVYSFMLPSTSDFRASPSPVTYDFLYMTSTPRELVVINIILFFDLSATHTRYGMWTGSELSEVPGRDVSLVGVATLCRGTGLAY